MLRIPFRSRLAYLWDSAEFTLAIHDYDVRLSQPRAPGYFLYVMFGRLVTWLDCDPHAGLVRISCRRGWIGGGDVRTLGWCGGEYLGPSGCASGLV